MTREELEAEVRRALAKRDSLAHDRRYNGAANDNAFVILVLRAADAYAAATVGEFAARRPAEPRIHLLAGGHLACRPMGVFVRWNTATTGDPAAVTCGGCRRTGAYKAAAS